MSDHQSTDEAVKLQQWLLNERANLCAFADYVAGMPGFPSELQADEWHKRYATFCLFFGDENGLIGIEPREEHGSMSASDQQSLTANEIKDRIASVIAMDADDDIAHCESCDKDMPWEQAHISGDIWMCFACLEAFQRDFAACEHEWQTTSDEHGEPARYCWKCSGQVSDEDWPALFPGQPLPEKVGSKAEELGR